MRALYVHGLLMTGREGALLRRRLRGLGVAAGIFRYRSRGEGPAEAAARLAARLRAEPGIALVGHSLGGLVAMAALAAAPAWRGRAVLLAPPLAGSAVARRLLSLPGGGWWLGAAREWLAGPPQFGAPPGRVAVIAGTRNVGIGRLLGACAPPGDGVVRLEETRLAGAPALVLRANHVELLFSARAAAATAAFIRRGVLHPAGDAAARRRDRAPRAG